MTVPLQPTSPPARQQVAGRAPERVAPAEALRAMLETLVQEAVACQLTEFLGARPHERTPTRRGWRNGSRSRTLLTRVGSLTLRVPRDRAGAFQPTLFARYQRSERALILTLAEMYLQGVSTRKVSAVVEQLCGRAVSASLVSACTKQLDAQLAAWRTRRLDALACPYLVVDAHEERIRREGQVLPTTALWVIGIRADGYREHLGLWRGASESRPSWEEVCRDLRRRGLRGVRYVVRDEHEGLAHAFRRYFPEAVHQRCQVHYLRNALSKVTRADLQDVLRTGLQNVWAAPTRVVADARARELVAALSQEVPRIADWLEATLEETLAFYTLPAGNARRRLRTTNAIEHDHAEVRRRTRVIRVFPNEASFLRLATALAMERSTRWAAKRYLIMPPAAQSHPDPTRARRPRVA